MELPGLELPTKPRGSSTQCLGTFKRIYRASGLGLGFRVQVFNTWVLGVG